jgi:hypothetical protein
MYWQHRPIEDFPSGPPFDGPLIEKAIQDKLGLRLESKKGTAGTVIIDYIEKTPSGTKCFFRLKRFILSVMHPDNDA